MYYVEALKAELEAAPFGREFDSNFDLIPVPLGDAVFVRDGHLFVSAESKHTGIDYYGEFQGGLPYINAELEAWAEAQGGYWEWESPGAIVLAK